MSSRVAISAEALLPSETLEDAYASCLRLARSHYENFPVASRWIPRNLRGPVAAVYAFAREADDFADEPGRRPEERLALLADWRERLETCGSRHGSHPVFWALSDAMSRFSLPEEPFGRLITAFEMDVRRNRFPAFEDLLFYCRHSANPVGELVLRLFGAWTERRGEWSDAFCTALQLANFWQDVSVDAVKGRIYVPVEDLRSMGVGEEEFLRGPVSPRLRDLMERQVERTRALFRRARPLCDEAPAALRLQLRLTWLGGSRILDKVREQRYDVWSRRPRLGPGDWLRMGGRCLLWRNGG